MIVIWILLGVLALIVLVVLIRTFTFPVPKTRKSESEMIVTEEMDEAVAKLSKAVTYRTIINSDYDKTDFSVFEDFRGFLKEAFPLCFQHMQYTPINTHAILLQWNGTNKDKKPILFLAHYDVVPAEQETLENWIYPPFDGIVADGKIHGRGTLDDKNELIALLQSAENMIKDGFIPTRDIFFAFGHDEEVGGKQGAEQIADYLKENDFTFEAVFDEGGLAIIGAIKRVKSPMAAIGLAEKGFNNFKLQTESEGGHSSTPPKYTALGDLARVVSKLENTPMKARLTPIVNGLLKNIAHEMGFAVKMAVANLWLFRPLLLKILSASPMTNAMIRTTFAVTMAKGSDAPNILPQKAEMTVNCRVLPGDTPQDAIDHIKKAANKTKIEIEPLLLEEPSPISRTDTPGWEKLIHTINTVYPNVLTTPYLVLGGTDARKYYTVSDSVYRFVPILVTSEERSTIHAANEAISIDNFKRMIVFYQTLIGTYDQ